MALAELRRIIGLRNGPEDIVFTIVGIRFAQAERPADQAHDTAFLLQEARENISVISKDLPSEIYGNDRVFSAFQQALERDCEVEFIVGAKADQEILKRLTSIGATVYQLKEHEPIRRFAVVDEKHVMLKTPHSDEQYTIKNYKYAKREMNEFRHLRELIIGLEELDSAHEVLGNASSQLDELNRRLDSLSLDRTNTPLFPPA